MLLCRHVAGIKQSVLFRKYSQSASESVKFYLPAVCQPFIFKSAAINFLKSLDFLEVFAFHNINSIVTYWFNFVEVS